MAIYQGELKVYDKSGNLLYTKFDTFISINDLKNTAKKIWGSHTFSYTPSIESWRKPIKHRKIK
jgi:hypothetical protein